MNGLQLFMDACDDAAAAIRAGRRDPSVPVVIGARELAEILHVDLEWIESRRHVLPCFDVPTENGVDSLDRFRVRLDDVGEWKRATKETR